MKICFFFKFVLFCWKVNCCLVKLLVESYKVKRQVAECMCLWCNLVNDTMNTKYIYINAIKQHYIWLKHLSIRWTCLLFCLAQFSVLNACGLKSCHLRITIIHALLLCVCSTTTSSEINIPTDRHIQRQYKIKNISFRNPKIRKRILSTKF